MLISLVNIVTLQGLNVIGFTLKISKKNLSHYPYFYTFQVTRIFRKVNGSLIFFPGNLILFLIAYLKILK